MMSSEGPSGLATPNTWNLGLAYASEGRVKVMHHDHIHHGITARCKGSHHRNYTVHVSYSCDSRGELESMSGSCSCPVAYNCKHCAAVVAAELRLVRPARGVVRANKERSKTGDRDMDSVSPSSVSVNVSDSAKTEELIEMPAWRRTLDRIFTPTGAPLSTSQTPLGLLFTFVPDSKDVKQSSPTSAYASTAFGRRLTELGYSFPSRPGSLRVVPVRAGRRQPWVRTGLSWVGIRNNDVGNAIDSHVDALNSLRRLYSEVNPYLGAQDPIALEKINHPALWAILAEMKSVGVALIEDDDFHPVALEPDPANALIEVRQLSSGDVRVQAAVNHSKLVGRSPMTKLGDPPHALVWKDEGGLHLSRMKRPVSHAWVQLAAERNSVAVPASDYDEFVQTVLPHITEVGWVSPDQSFVPPPQPTPRLHLELEVLPANGEEAEPRAHLRWGWHYRDDKGRGRGPLPLEGASRDTTRDPEEEEEISSKVADQVLELSNAVNPTGRCRLRQNAELSGMDVVRLCEDIVPKLVDMGVVFESSDMPEFQQAGEATVKLGLNERGDKDWLDLQVTVDVEGHELPIADLIRALARGHEAFFLPDGSYLRLDNPELNTLRDLLEEAAQMGDQRTSDLRVPRIRTTWWEELLSLGIVQTSTNEWLSAVGRAMSQPPEPVELPEGLHAQLRPYQQEGFQWLAHLRRSGLGGVLADDMGLGKTVQVLAMILDERQNPTDSDDRGPRPWVVVAPTSVVPNWVCEAQRFAPDLKVVAITATDSRRSETLSEIAQRADIVVTSYALVRLDAEEYAALRWAGMILDEAQNTKNHSSKVFAAISGVDAPVRYAITGTPMENNLAELWSMFSLTAPGLLGAPKKFREHYERPIERKQDTDGVLMSQLKRRITPFLLRRTKDQVALDLPPKQEQIVRVDLSPSHRRIYDRQLQYERQRVLQLTADMDHNQIEVLAALTRLRQLAIDPSLVDQGKPDPHASSSKLDYLVPLLEEAAEEGHRVLVFSQFTRYLRKIGARLEHEKIKYSYLDGSTPRRGEVIDGFTHGDAPVFLISLKAGGAGINLTQADYAILADPWWNPAVENQAVDRAHRIGQTRPVHVYRLVSTGTIEEKVLALQAAKRELISSVLGTQEGESAANAAGGGTRLSAEDVRMLLS